MSGNVAGAGNCDHFAVEVLVPGGQHLFHEIDQAETGGFQADVTATEFDILAGEHSGKVIGKASIVSEQVADFTTPDIDVTRRDINVIANVAIQLVHEGITETHDLTIGTLPGVEIRTALGPANTHAGKSVLKHLFKSKKFQHRLVDRGMKAQPALVGADQVTVLYPPAAIDLNASFIVFPGHAERDNPVRFRQTLQEIFLFVNRVIEYFVADVVDHFPHGLKEFILPGIALFQVGKKTVEISCCHN